MAVFLVFAGIGAAVVSYSWMREHVAIEEATTTGAETAFNEVRQRFAAKPPLLEMHGRTVAKRNVPAADAPRTSLTMLHVLAWDDDEEKLARIDLPFWLLRLKETPIRFGTYATGLNELGIALTASDLERYGSGIVLDLDHGGERALLWVE
ncbi:MAG: hypothetical protein OEW19_01075 [Acidobacteriota bacterium]|nr:hypothetical protein [Acidobacteriota bacterium]